MCLMRLITATKEVERSMRFYIERAYLAGDLDEEESEESMKWAFMYWNAMRILASLR